MVLSLGERQKGQIYNVVLKYDIKYNKVWYRWLDLQINSIWVNPKGNQSWICIGRTDAEAKTPIFWPSDVKNWLIGRDADSGKDWRQEDKGMTEDKMVGWHHRLDGYEFEQAPGVGDGQGSLACCSPRGRKESDTIERLNWTELRLNYLPSKRYLHKGWFGQCSQTLPALDKG